MGAYETLGSPNPFGRLYIPDLVVIPYAAVDEVEDGGSIPLTAAELVVEITSLSNASYDRINKAAAYAQAGFRCICSSIASPLPAPQSHSSEGRRAMSTGSSSA
ncbi:Uma2 family endonuclease [Streptomyces sp. M19]